MSENTIVIKNLRKSFKNITVLDGINFSVRHGTILTLLGPNGAGKTTTIRILSTLLLPNGGQASINGLDVVKDANKVRSLIGLTGQYAAVDEYLTGKENLHMMGRLYRLSYQDIRKRTQELLELFDLKEASVRAVKTYSGGMRRRLDLAVSLIASPPIIFLDEPTTGLDPRSRLLMWEIIKKLATNGTTILLTTQDMEEADQLSDRIVVIDEGKVIAEGTSDELKQLVGSERLEITIADRDSFEMAKGIMDGNVIHSDSKRLIISIAANDGVHQLKEVLNCLDETGIKVKNISLHSPTLDDVFLTLTGHKTVNPEEIESQEDV